MKIVNTPAERFENLPDYPFQPNYKTVGDDDLQMHYIDESPENFQKGGETVLLMHGEPSWSFLYRKMIPVFVENGFRVLAPDLIGFGKSSKPTQKSDYTYARFVEWTTNWLEQLDLQNVTIFTQDWGGLIGLRLVTAMPDRFSRVVVGNTGLPTGDHEMPKAFTAWQTFSKVSPIFPLKKIMQNSTVTKLSKEVLEAYKAPFPSDKYMAGARIFPSLVPTTPNDPESQNNRDAWKILSQWEKPFLTLFSDKDPITKGGERVFMKLVPGTKGQPHQKIEGGGHFLQEDKGKEIAEIMVKWMKMS